MQRGALRKGCTQVEEKGVRVDLIAVVAATSASSASSGTIPSATIAVRRHCCPWTRTGRRLPTTAVLSDQSFWCLGRPSSRTAALRRYPRSAGVDLQLKQETRCDSVDSVRTPGLTRRRGPTPAAEDCARRTSQARGPSDRASVFAQKSFSRREAEAETRARLRRAHGALPRTAG
jgi:hypothetical protein